MSDKKIIIAVDGFSSCGKSTFAKKIAAKLGYNFIDSGAMYRAVTLYALRKGVIESDGAVVDLLKDITIEFKFNADSGKSDIYLCGENVESEIRQMEVSSNVSRVSAIAQVRAFLTVSQQAMGSSKGIVMDGRDIGTSVFPGAELKLFMVADPHVRAERRYKEMADKGVEVSIESIEANINERDYIDQNRKESPLRKADDAIELDNSYMSVEEQMEWVEKLITERIK